MSLWHIFSNCFARRFIENALQNNPFNFGHFSHDSNTSTNEIFFFFLPCQSNYSSDIIFDNVYTFCCSWKTSIMVKIYSLFMLPSYKKSIQEFLNFGQISNNSCLKVLEFNNVAFSIFFKFLYFKF